MPAIKQDLNEKWSFLEVPVRLARQHWPNRSLIIRPRVASLLSIKSIQEDLQVSPNSIDRWLTILENLYYCYRISPYGTHRIKALKKTQKIYLWDWSELESAGAKFENMVASHLLKFCHYHEDYYGHRMELRYLKDVEGREVDFVVIKNKIFNR